MTTYRIITMTDDTGTRWCILETRVDGSDRVVSEHQTEDDAVSYIGELRERDFFWSKKTNA